MLNVYNKEKSECVKIWKQLTEKYKKTCKIKPNHYLISSTFLSGNGNLNISDPPAVADHGSH